MVNDQWLLSRSGRTLQQIIPGLLYAPANCKLVNALRCGAKPFEIAKGKNTIQVAGIAARPGKTPGYS